MPIKSLIDTTYFNFSDRYIPNSHETELDRVQDDINHFIQIGEREILMRAFGLDMYKDFKQYVGVGGLLSNAPDNYKDIVYGKDYTVLDSKGDEYSRSWKGLIDKELCKDSLIADYVYYIYWQNNVTHTSDMGEVKNVGKVSTAHSISHKTSSAYNRFLDCFQGGYDLKKYHYHSCGYSLPFSIVRNRLNNGYGLNYNTIEYNNYSGEVSLLTFLYDMNNIDENTYPLLRNTYLFDSGLKYKNSFGL